MKKTALQHQFVKSLPDKLQEGVLYISMDFATAAHKCCCGCGHDVMTPFSPTDWNLIFDGRTVSLYPSVGNWSLACQSHYWIDHGRIKWAAQWTKEQINANRAYDLRAKNRFYDTTKPGQADAASTAQPAGFRGLLKRWFNL